MMAALFESMLTDRLGRVIVRSSGFGPEGLPAIDDAVAAMKRRGLDVSQHRSASTTRALVDGADVIITAERAHVVKIAALSPSAFARAMTLPELLARAADVPLAPDGAGVRAWVESLTAARTAGAYLREPVAEVADPTGSMPRAFEVGSGRHRASMRGGQRTVGSRRVRRLSRLCVMRFCGARRWVGVGRAG